ncbi:MAG TPA: PQQ-dependent sugar dehydrogenase [Saprospiraceae bacterium]|nr:PQQ-dependent sugar dehydrogenase [Saprospiraceae bacterium]HPG09086.1 PQQ-dependent sugar dehydrogenase [Saprospiraceae bacterium]HPQ99004.1 PQQ-dependent sugar dehydrogenase [Saprospiraceae bacterium]HRV86020.1 PQQ-dependent sugar dehydrogenase [Saprospiraceae bacterium]
MRRQYQELNAPGGNQSIRHPGKYRILFVFAMLVVAGAFWHCSQGEQQLKPDPDDGGLALPDGFRALVVHPGVGRARHLAVTGNGDIYIKLRVPNPKGIVALRDVDHDGRADSMVVFGDYEDTGNYGTAMRIHNGYIYFTTAGELYRQKLTPGQLVPETPVETIMVDDYKNAFQGFEHIAKPIAFDEEGHVFVPFGAPGDICQLENRKPGTLGQEPCPQLETHGGVWRFDENKTNQVQADGYRYATGIRSFVAMAWNPQDHKLYGVQHGRDDLYRSWPELFSTWQSAVQPSEEFIRVDEGSDHGWPYYYYDWMTGKKLLNPEYGGDGKLEGDGAKYPQPLIGFPGHWAPNDLLFYQGDQFPEHYKQGAFIAWHGSTIRSPYPQAGYFVAFVPFKDGQPSGPWEVFADDFSKVDTIINTSDAGFRPMGLAEGPDGSLYISESEEGRIWRVVFQGDREHFGPEQLASIEAHKERPNIKNPDPVEDNLDRFRASIGQGLYTTYCGACHQADGKGDGTRFPPLLNSEYVSGDMKELVRIILKGMEGPMTVNGQGFNGAMPANDFLTDDELALIVTYIRREFGNGANSLQAYDARGYRNRIRREDRAAEAAKEKNASETNQ